MRTHMPLAVLLPMLLVGCGKKAEVAKAPEPPPIEKVLPTIPLPPDGTPLASSSGTDATQLVIVSPHPVDSVAAYYRGYLGRAPFRLVSDHTADGVTTFYAEQDGPSIWITVQANGKEGSQVIIAGAANGASAKADSGADSTKGH